MARGTQVRGGVFSDTTGRRGMAFLRHSLRWKHGQRAYLCFRGFLSVTREGGAGAEGVVSARRAGTARQAMSGDGAGSAEEVAEGGGVGVPCG